MTEEIEALKEAILVLANYVDGLAWRVSTREERIARTDIHSEIRRLLEVEK